MPEVGASMPQLRMLQQGGEGNRLLMAVEVVSTGDLASASQVPWSG